MVRRPNIVFIVLDSVRYDRTSIGGHHRDTTPNVQRIAASSEGTSFDTAMSHAKHTSKSSASILTGTYPSQHRFGYESTSLDPGVPTVAESFRDADYATGCVSNNGYISEETGLSRGFEDFTLLPKQPLEILREVGVGQTLRFLANIRSHSAGFQRDLHRHSGAYLTTSLVRKQLRRFRDRPDPFFLYVHYNQPHRAYYPPLAWMDTYADAFEMSPSEAGEFAMDVHRNLTEKVAQGCPFTDDQWAALKALYDTEIKYTDTFVGELYDFVQRSFDDTIFVVTADHGEHFGEHGALAHRYVLDDAVLNVPLVVSGLDVASTGLVQHTDVMRTLLAEAGARTEHVEGVDLRTETREFAVSQDSQVDLGDILDINPEFDPSAFYPTAKRTIPERTTVRTDEFRYVRGIDDSQALFDLPDEETDASANRPDVTEEMAATLADWFDDHEPPVGHGASDDSDLSKATKTRLQDMGYLEEDL